MSTATRSRSAAGSRRDVGELRAELGDHPQVDAVLQLGERLEVGRRHGPLGRESLVKLHLLSPSEDSAPAAGGRRSDRFLDLGARVELRKLTECHRRVRLRLGGDDRHSFVDAARDLPVARDENVQLASEDVADVARREARRGCARG